MYIVGITAIMRFILLLYTFICWAYPLLLVFGIGASGHGYGSVDKTLLIMAFAAILIIPLNYYFLYRVFIIPPFTSRQLNSSLVFLLATLLVMVYWSFDALRQNEIFWVSYLPPIGLISTMFFIVMLWRKKSQASE
jgi:hypothetical protein